MPKVSVIIPTYNHADGVKETIASVLSQTERDMELIVVDDGSTDGTRDAVVSLDDDRVRYLYKSNGGPASARNHGLATATGRYVAFLDHDDLWPSSFLEVMQGHLRRRPDFGVAYSAITVRFEDGQEVKSYKRPRGESGWLTDALFRHGFVWTSATVIRAEALRGIRFDESLRRSYEDGDFFLRLSMRTPFLFVSDVEAIKRQHQGNLSSEVGTNPTRILVLERFLFRLGGDKMIPRRLARKRLSHACRSVASVYRQMGRRTAARTLYRRALSYRPYDLGLYTALIRASCLSRTRDPDPDWRMPDPLPDI